LSSPSLPTSAEKEALQLALESALLVAAKARSADHALFFQIPLVGDGNSPGTAIKELRELFNVISATTALEFFSHADQCALGYIEKVNFRFLALWLISRAQHVGAEQAVNDLMRYLETETIEVTETLAVDGFSVEHKIELGEYQVIPWNDVPMTDTKWQIMSRSLFGGKIPTSVIVRRHKVQRRHVRPWDSPAPYLPSSIEPALDILRCVTVVANAGFRLLHYWFEPEEWAPWAVSCSNFGVDTTTMFWKPNLSEALVPQLLETASHFRNLDESTQLRLRVPLDRLNRSYLAGMRSLDKAIELGIALESLYAPTKLSEGIAYAVRTRAARFLGGSLEERHRTVKLLKDVYDLRSRAVHAGRFDVGSKKWLDETHVRAVLESGQSLVGRSLVKVIKEGEPNWEEFDIKNV
jgi:hypothetical protein